MYVCITDQKIMILPKTCPIHRKSIIRRTPGKKEDSSIFAAMPSGQFLVAFLPCFFLLLFIIDSIFAQGENDLVKELPGLIFDTNFKAYSGYLYADSRNETRMHYWYKGFKAMHKTFRVLAGF